jgi:hypothetical protein
MNPSELRVEPRVLVLRRQDLAAREALAEEELANPSRRIRPRIDATKA